MEKEKILGYGIQLLLIFLTLIIMLIGGIKFLIISVIFYGGGGIFEFMIMNYFYSKDKEKISKKDKFSKKIKNGFLWVHRNCDFIKKYNTTIYNFKGVGQLPSFTSYLIMLLYVVLAFFLFKKISYYAFIIYTIPIITNIFSFFKYHYEISDYRKGKR
jgi:hypothetical protein